VAAGDETIAAAVLRAPALLSGLTPEAVAGLGLEATCGKVEDYPTIVGYGVMSTPGLVVDEKVVVSGRVPTVAQVRDLLAAAG